MVVPVLRVARPTDRLEEVARFYREGLGFAELSRFADHDGFDGVILGHLAAPWHLEFTHRRGHAVSHALTEDHLLVLYLPDRSAWEEAVGRMERRGGGAVPSFNPWWDRQGRTYEDPDGYRIVLQHAAWTR